MRGGPGLNPGAFAIPTERRQDMAHRGTPSLLLIERRWACPNCDLEDVTREARPHTRFHTCRGLRGLTAPMVPAGTRCKVEAVERGDYVGRELVQTDGEGRPVMSVVTTRDDGTDCAVLAPTAVATKGEL